MAIRDGRKESIDELAITKAAAWAWYERGSWFEQESIRETDCRRARSFTPRPSRYKLEAMKKLQKENQDSISCNLSTIPLLGNSEHFNNSLLDMYEIERISSELGCYVESSRVEHLRRKALDDGDPHGGRRIMSDETESKRTGKKKNAGFFMRYGIACGSSSDSVAEHAILTGGRRRRKDDFPVIGATHGRFRRL